MGPRSAHSDEAGYSLIELIVAASLGVLVLTLLGGMMVASISAQNSVTTTMNATGEAQVLARQLESQVRLASVVYVVDGADTDSQLLVARTETGSGGHDWECQAWFYDDTAKAIFHTTFPGNNNWPWGSSITNWIDLGSGLTEAVDVGGIVTGTLDWLFGRPEDGVVDWQLIAAGVDQPVINGARVPVFDDASSRSVLIRYAYQAGEQTPVLISTTATGRQAEGSSNPRCY